MIYTALHNRLLAATLAVFCFFLVATVAAWKTTNDVVIQESHHLFFQNSVQIRDWVQNRLNIYILAIEGLPKFVELQSSQLQQDEWSTYLTSIRLFEKYPGISSVGYAQKEVSGDNTVFIVRYLDPTAGQEKVLGFDLTSEENWRRSLERARDTGRVSSTGKVWLTVPNTPGFALVAPVYKEREGTNIKGFVFAAFRGQELFRAIYGQTDPFPNLDFEIYDGDNLVSENLLYDHDPGFKISQSSDDSRLVTLETVNIDGQKWTILIATKEGLGLAKSQEILPKIVLASGFLISSLFLAFFLYQYRLHLATH